MGERPDSCLPSTSSWMSLMLVLVHCSIYKTAEASTRIYFLHAGKMRNFENLKMFGIFYQDYHMEYSLEYSFKIITWPGE